MCAACVAEGSAYVGTALVSLKVMAVRASSRRRRAEEERPSVDVMGIVHEELPVRQP